MLARSALILCQMALPYIMVDGSAQSYLMLDYPACSDLVLVVSAQNRCYEVQLTLDGDRRYYIILLKLGATRFSSVLELNISA